MAQIGINDLLTFFIVILILWVAFVPGLYLTLIHLFNVKQPSTFIRILYGLFFIVLSVYTLLLSPFSAQLVVGSIGFFVIIAILIIVVLLLVLNIFRRR